MFGFNEKKFSVLMLGCVFATSFFSCTSNNDSKTNITITASSENTKKLMEVANQFNLTNKNYQISFETYENENIKNYYLAHGKTNGGIIAFDYCSIGQNYSDKLMNLNRFDIIDKYQVNIKNYIRDINGDLYFLPSPGAFYTNCYNYSMLSNLSLSIPNTMSDLLTLSDRLNSYEFGNSYPVSATSGGDNSVLCALMSVVAPEVMDSIKCNSFFKDYLNGKVKMNDDYYRSWWTQSFMYLSSLYEQNYFSLNDLTSNSQKGLEDFNNNKTYAILNTPEINEDLISEDSYKLSPFVGENENDKCVGSTPLYYLSISNSVNISSKRYQGIKEFFTYYSSQEGQNYALKYDGASRINHISYLKENQNSLSDKYKELEKYINTGKVFIADYFFAIFKENVDLLTQYLRNKISIFTLINSLDEYIAKQIDKDLIETYQVNNDYDFDSLGRKITDNKSKIGSLYINLLSKAIGYGNDCTLLIPSTVINANIFKGSLSEIELNVVFQDLRLEYCIIKGFALKNYLSTNKGYIFLTNNITSSNNTILCSNQIVNDDDGYFVLLQEEDFNRFDQKDIVSSNGKEINSNEEIKKYLDTVKVLD